MSAKLEKSLLAAHVNALEKTLAAVEVQVAAVKTVLKLAKVTKPTADETDEDDAEELDEESDDETDEDEESDEDDAPAKPTKKAVVKALQAYAAENDRAASIKMLKKFGVKSVHDLPAAKYGKLIAALEA